MEVGGLVLVDPVALTRLLSYSFLEAAKSWALEIAMPQKGRYICSTCGHVDTNQCKIVGLEITATIHAFPLRCCAVFLLVNSKEWVSLYSAHKATKHAV